MIRVKEIFYSLQGEGRRSGRPAVFCRFSGCNLACPFCDTDHVGVDGSGGGEYGSAEELAEAVFARFPACSHPRYAPYVVFTGGEPALQLTFDLVAALKRRGCEIAAETNGTLPLPPGLDWICVSPKAGAELVVARGHELKLVWPQDGLRLEDFESLDFDHFLLQPRDGDGAEEATRQAVAACLARPIWSLSVQIHKRIGIP